MSEPVTLTLRPSGPENRDEFFDALKAFFIVRGYEAMSMSMPPALYNRWVQNLPKMTTTPEEHMQDGGFRIGNVYVQEGSAFSVS